MPKLYRHTLYNGFRKPRQVSAEAWNLTNSTKIIAVHSPYVLFCMQTPCPQHILWGDCIRKSDHILHRLSFLASRGCTVCRPRSQVWGMATCHPRHSRLPSGIPHKLCLGLQDWVHRLCECPESKGTRQKDGLVGSMCKQIVGSKVWIRDWH